MGTPHRPKHPKWDRGFVSAPGHRAIVEREHSERVGATRPRPPSPPVAALSTWLRHGRSGYRGNSYTSSEKFQWREVTRVFLQSTVEAWAMVRPALPGSHSKAL